MIISTIKNNEENKTVDCLNSLKREKTINEDQCKNSLALHYNNSFLVLRPFSSPILFP